MNTGAIVGGFCLLGGAVALAAWLESAGTGAADGGAEIWPEDTADNSTGNGGGMTESGAEKIAKMPAGVVSLINKYAAQFGVSPDLALAQAYAESGGKQTARSGVGAIGVYQLMPATAADLGVNPYDTEQNIAGGIKYMSQLLKRYSGDEPLALAAYNAGMGNVQKYGGIPPFAETQNYVQKILGMVGAA